MALYQVSYKGLKKTVTLELDENLVRNIELSYRNSAIHVLMLYRNATGYSKFLRHEGLKIQKIKQERVKTSLGNSFAHRTDSRSACNNPHCVDCENGRYDRCRYQ